MFKLIKFGITGDVILKIIKKVFQLIFDNIIETFITIGTVFICIGVFLIFKPLAFIVLGSISMLMAFLIYKN